MNLTMDNSQEISSLQVLAFLAIALLALYTCTTWFVQYRRLRNFQGPRSAPWLNVWLFRKMVGGEMHLDFYKAFKEHGKHHIVGSIRS